MSELNSAGATETAAATVLAQALTDAAPAFGSAAACRLDAGPDVTDVFGGRIKALLSDPDRANPRQWGRHLARTLLARAPHLAQLPGPVLADVVGTLADVVRADVAEARGDRASLAGAISDLDQTLQGLRPGREVPVDVLSDLLTPGRSELADALDEAADSPLGLAIHVTLADGTATVRRDPDRAGGLVVELFGGAGGWAEGLLSLGIHDVAAITEVLDGADPADMTERWADIRAGLVLEIVRWARDLRPDFIACEETPGAKPVFAAIAGALQALGYRTVTFVVNAADYGLGQTRKRVILLAHRRRQPRIPDPTHSKDGTGTTRRWRSMADTVGFGLTDRPAPTLCARNAGGGPRYEGGSGARASIRAAQAASRWTVRHNPDGSIDPADAKAARGETGVSVYGRMTPSEAGVLQGFRPDYQWQGTTSQQVSCVGNAVPPPLARAMVAELIGAHDAGLERYRDADATDTTTT
jgi:hypothetical protein